MVVQMVGGGGGEGAGGGVWGEGVVYLHGKEFTNMTTRERFQGFSVVMQIRLTLGVSAS